jgi:predicted DNA binding protein
MREFVFSVTFDRGADPLMDVFIDHPDLRSEAFLCCLSETKLWRLERAVGPTEALDRVEEIVLDPHLDRASISERPCESEQYHDRIAATDESRVLYTYREEISRCDAIPVLASRYLPGGLVFETTRYGDEQRWRILLQDDERVGLLYDTLHGKLRDGLTFEFDHVGDATTWATGLLSSVSIPPEQQRVLETAAERGYYETPREVTLDEIADALGLPRSTVSYRLRRAESQLVGGFLTDGL